ncbi:MAG TPA: DUF2188 domain-containing protein [Solirubrobacterales bacterium]|nr:DUF2188 domain-containing protein [Solirubrobacterales bacterium]
MSKSVHVVPSGDGWIVEIDGEAASHLYPSRREAARVGQQLARANRSEFVLHGPDGRVRQRDSFRRDPVAADH